MPEDTNDKVRKTLLGGLLNPWVGVAALAGAIVGYIIGRVVG
jgi:hypothetical protein